MFEAEELRNSFRMNQITRPPPIEVLKAANKRHFRSLMHPEGGLEYI